LADEPGKFVQPGRNGGPFEAKRDMESTILFVTEAVAAHGAAADALMREFGYRVILAKREAEAAEVIANASVDLILADIEAASFDAVAFLFRLRFAHPDLIRILITGAVSGFDLRPAIERAAVYQCLSKPLQPEQTSLVVRRALETRELARRHRRLVRELKIGADSPILASRGKEIDKAEPAAGAEAMRFERLVFASPAMAELCRLAREAARTDLPILIEGETGTGKELLARGVHFHSRRAASPLMLQNCGGLRDELLHSELFGHKKGAFTGATCDRLGLFRAADGGTVFLDEISDVSPAFQVSLLRFLQEGEVKPLGSDQTLHADVRIIAASNKPLRKLVKAGLFREDLYFRLKGFQLDVPPLRERPADIPVLANYFLKKHGGLVGHRVAGISEEVIQIFKSYDFPGNVRELEYEIRRMMAVAREGEILTRRHLSKLLAALSEKAHSQSCASENAGATLKEMVERLEGQLVVEALARHGWNQSKAARELGLSRVGLANKIRRYALSEGLSGQGEGTAPPRPQGLSLG
jgi:two-component system response regulator HupR/HoxA